MICHYNDPIHAGKRYRIYDANGLLWSHVIECDTETGRIVRYKLNDHGSPYVDWTREEMAKETVYGAAPLLVVEVKPT